ncbi:MAG: hypothetical protein ABF679_04545 [Lentilactobacillus diolivorans]|jgi:hypothetical protein|uniref:hypothetical protein n=1 Tax=Lentilactobacillus diolivorans TaxID=179838 RepID=UPI000FF2A0BC|nr:hypothetical protein [Lentilactobacillus diolivorans]RRG01658.1 MAG: hypothetical protein DUD34_11420 [Lactobacillus sp.]
MTSKMRTKLREKGSKNRCYFSGEFKKYGFKYSDRNKSHALPTILLMNIKDEQHQLLTDHLWFNVTKGFRSLGILQLGDQVSFNGRVKPYKKGYQGRRKGIQREIQIDYKIDRPTQVKLIVSVHNFERDQFLSENWKMCNQIYEMYKSDYQLRGIPLPYPEY